MIYLLLIPCIGAIVWGCRRWGRTHYGDGEGVAVMFGSIGIFVILLVAGICTLVNGAGLAKWQAFYTVNTQNYTLTIDATASYLSEKSFEGKLMEGSIEKMEQAGYVSERIAEWRDAVNQYNLAITSMKYFNRNVFTGVLVPDGVEDMKLLIIR